FWKGGYTWVGEKGPEIIEAPRGSRIHSNSKSMEMAKGTTIQNLNITIPAKDIREFKDVTEFFAKLPQTVKAGVVYG
ncbi:MAG TPA: hypothetical protein VFC79_11400, partial [Tissierellaceae bacterium]|nr:hypothetical protein [Tissierellaceae bacterium]